MADTFPEAQAELVTLRQRASQLAAQCQSLRGIVESAAAPIFSVDGAYRYTSFNRRHAEVMQRVYGAETEIGKSLLACIPTPEERERTRRNLDRALAGETFADEIHFGADARARQYFRVAHSPIRDDAGVTVGVAIVGSDLTARVHAEEESKRHLRFLEVMDLVNRAIHGKRDTREMMSDVLDVTLDVFDCDRAFLLYPCDPSAPTWTIPMERNRPEFPGVRELGLELPMDADVAETLRILRAADEPVAFGPETDHPLPSEVSERFGILSFLSMAIHPRVGKSWQFGIHQCSRIRDWSAEEARLLQEIGRRIADALTVLSTDKDLRESEARYRRIVATANEGIWVLGPDLRTEFVNARMTEMLGYSADEMLSRSPDDFLFEEDRPEFQTRMQNRRRGVSESFERRFRHRQGSAVWTMVSATPILDEQGGFCGAFAMHGDITERKRTEEDLRRSEWTTSLLNQIADVFLTVSDQDMYAEVLDIIRVGIESPFGLFGFLEEDGSLVLPSMTRDVWERCQVETRSITFPRESWGDSMWGRAIREQRSFRSTGPFHVPEGHVDVNAFLAVPIVCGGESVGLLCLANRPGGYSAADEELLEHIAGFIAPILKARLQRDVQEKRRRGAEEALRASEQKYRLLVSNADEGIVIVQDGVIKFANPRAVDMLGRAEAELTEETFVRLVHPEDRSIVVERYFDGQTDGAARVSGAGAAPFRLVDSSGTTLWVQLTAAPVPWEGLSGTLCFLRDVTDAVTLEAQYRQAQKLEAIGRLAGGVAHDFNNLLLVINGQAEMALDELHSAHPVRSGLMEIVQAGDRAATLTRQLLAFSRKQVMMPRFVDLNGLVAGVEKMLRRLIGEDIDLVTSLGAALGPIKADPGQMEQILMNLATNARDAMPRGGRLEIETANVDLDERYVAAHVDASEGPHVRLSVSDSGCGMAEDTLSHMFEPFFTTKEEDRGTGLGLATVHGIVRQSGGSIHVESVVGRGTTFFLYFPRVEGDVEDRIPEPLARRDGAGETVLVVEDDGALRAVVSRMLKRAGYDVLEASGGQEAIRLAERQPGAIDLLVTDVVMPRMDGREAARQLLRLDPGLRVLYISGYPDRDGIGEEMVKEGAAFLQKPFRVTTLLARVREVLDRAPVIHR